MQKGQSISQQPMVVDGHSAESSQRKPGHSMSKPEFTISGPFMTTGISSPTDHGNSSVPTIQPDVQQRNLPMNSKHLKKSSMSHSHNQVASDVSGDKMINPNSERFYDELRASNHDSTFTGENQQQTTKVTVTHPIEYEMGTTNSNASQIEHREAEAMQETFGKESKEQARRGQGNPRNRIISPIPQADEPSMFDQRQLSAQIQQKVLKPTRNKVAMKTAKSIRQRDQMTYREFREMQRSLEKAELGPGAYFGNHPTFGENAQRVKFNPPSQIPPLKREQNPGPGTYDTDRGYKVMQHNNLVAKIQKPHNLYKKPQEYLPEPATYDPPSQFGADAQSVKIAPRKSSRNKSAESLSRGKYGTSADFNDQSRVDDLKNSRLFGGDHSNISIQFMKMREDSPDPTRYQTIQKDFAKDAQNVLIGDNQSFYSSAKKLSKTQSRLQFSITENPGPGTYNYTSNRQLDTYVQTPKIIKPVPWTSEKKRRLMLTPNRPATPIQRFMSPTKSSAMKVVNEFEESQFVAAPRPLKANTSTKKVMNHNLQNPQIINQQFSKEFIDRIKPHTSNKKVTKPVRNLGNYSRQTKSSANKTLFNPQFQSVGPATSSMSIRTAERTIQHKRPMSGTQQVSVKPGGIQAGTYSSQQKVQQMVRKYISSAQKAGPLNAKRNYNFH